MGNLSALPALDVKAPPNALAEFGQVAALQGQMQQRQLQQQEMQLRQQQINDQQATTQAMQNWDPKSQSYDDLAKSVLNNGGSANAAMAVSQHGLQVQQGIQNLSKDKQANYLSGQKAIGDTLAPGMDRTIVPDDQLHNWALDRVVSLTNGGLLDPNTAQQYIQQIQQTNDPNSLRALVTQTAKLHEGAAQIAAQQKTEAETEQAQGKGREANANATLKEIEAKGLQGITPQYIVDTAQDPVTRQQALNALARGDVMGAQDALKAGFQSALGVQKDIAVNTNPQIQGGKIAVANAEGAARLAQQQALLTPEARAMAAQYYGQTGAMPAGMRSPGMSAGILNTAAANPEGAPNVAGNKQSYQANTASLESLQKNADQVSAFENTAGKNLDIFLKAAQPVLDSGSPWINKPLRAVDSGALGSADMAAFNAARQTAVTEIAKVLNSSNASGVLSDAARHEVEGLIGPDASLKQVYSAANILKQDMANRHQAYQQQLAEIRNRSLGQTGTTQTAAPQQTAGHKIGDIIVQGNHQFKATKVDENGKVIAADPL